MCRLAYIPYTGIMSKEEMEKLLDFLEKKNGGHGNGIGGFINDMPMVIKGIKITTQVMADLIVKRGWTNGVIFHSRMASKGSINDENCHPFGYNGSITCHNGHWMDSREVKWHMLFNGLMDTGKISDCTDSEIIACLVGRYGFEVTKLVSSGVILTITKDKVMVNVNGDFEAVRIGNKWLYASEFPEDFKCDEHMEFKSGTIAVLRVDGYDVLEGEVAKYEKPTYYNNVNIGKIWNGYNYCPVSVETHAKNKRWWSRDNKKRVKKYGNGQSYYDYSDW